MFKNREDYIKIVENVEQRVSDFLGNSIDFNLWFIFKIQLSYQLHLSYSKNKWADLSGYRASYIKYKSISEIFKILIKLLKIAPKVFYYNWITKYPNLDILLIGHTDHNENKSIEQNNNYLHPFLSIYKDQSYLIYYTNYSTGPAKQLKYLKILEVWHKGILALKYKFFKQHKQKFLSYSRLIAKELKKASDLNINGLEFFLADQVAEYNIYLTIYKNWLKRIKPTKVISYCYYNNKVNAIYGASNSLGIESIEYQHSAISSHHFAYQNWRHIDEMANHFPTTFFVWQEIDKKIIETNFKGKKYQPKIIVSGILHLKLGNTKKIKKKQNNVLICLQGIWMPMWLENYIIADTNFNWYVRLHPRYPNDKNKLDALNKLNKSNLFIQEANSKTLADLVQQCPVLLTNFSGSALETSHMGAKVIIYGSEGFASYQEQIKEGIFGYVTNKTELNKQLKSFKY